MKIGVIGLGSIGMRHTRNLIDLGHSVVSHDPNVPSAERIQTLKTDALVIASPTRLHFYDLCDGDPQRTFVEKPIAENHYQLTAIYQSPPAMVGYNLRFHGCVRKAQEWLPRIGRPMWANFTCGQFNSKPTYMRDGVILNWSHEIDLALHLLGPAKVSASSVRITDEHDDMADILLTHENGCRSTIHLDYITNPEQRHFTIQGEAGRLTCTLPSRNLFLLTEEKEDADWFHCKGSYDQDYLDEIKAFVDRVEGKSTPGCTGEEALKVLEICLEVRRQAGL